MNKIKKEYLSPELTVVEFKVERGYAASIDAVAQRINMYVDMAGSEVMDKNTDGSFTASYLENRETGNLGSLNNGTGPLGNGWWSNPDGTFFN